ncbi:MAG: carboxypeptidase regulatory-like domain-containing protein [Acidobacteriota bacterium]
MRRFAVILLAFPSFLGAQEFRGAILGRITDSSGAVVVGAGIQVTNVETNVAVSTAANQEGNYQVPFLLPGNYVVRVEHPGFKKVERPGVRVSVGAQVTLNFVLEVGAAAETVTVTASAPLLNAASADVGQVVEKTYVDMMTVTVRRNVVSLVHLTPGITTDGWETTYTDNSQSQISISGGGGTRGRVEFLVDGVPNSVPIGGGVLTFAPTMDAVEEFKVHTTLFDAAYGHSNGGAVSITTRGGTNELHSALYFHKMWAALNANTWTNNRLGAPKAPTNRHEWGYALGGPVYVPKIYSGRNRTFFSTSLEWDDRKTAATRQGRVPTALEREGDFSQTLNRLGTGALRIYDPATTIISGTAATRQPFPGERIPSSRLNPTGLAVMHVYPAPNIAGVPQIGRYNWTIAGYYPVLNRNFSARIDHGIGNKHRLFGRFGRMQRDQNNIEENFTFPGFSGAPEGGSSDHNLRYFTSLSLDDTIMLSPSFVGSLRYGISRRATKVINGAGAGLDPAGLRLPDIIVRNQATKGYPFFSPGENMVSIGGGLSRDANDLHALLATFTKLTGRHSLKFGGDYRLIRWNRLSPGSAASGNFGFSPTFTQADPYTPRSADTTGSAMASLLLGVPSSGSFGYQSPLSLQTHYLAGFVQEDWKVNPRLTVNFGLRYELETPYTERYNRVSYTFDPNARLPVQIPPERAGGMDLRGGILFAGVDGHPRREGTIDKNSFGPRFGFAFSATPKTVVRGGYGLFYSPQVYNTSFLGDVGVFSAVTPYVATNDNGATPFTTLANPFPAGLRQPQGASAGLMAQVGDSLSYYHADRVSPYNQQWQFGIQRELPSQILVEAVYIGMLSLKQFESFNLNEKLDRYLVLGTAENNRVPNPFLGVFPATSSLGQGTTITQRSLWPAFPQFTSLTMDGANTGRAVYHALQVKVEKRLTHGLNLLWNYTNSKLMDNNTTSIVNERHYRSVSGFDQAQMMRLAFVYQLPSPSARTGAGKALNQVLGGWSVSAFWSLASGQPLSISHANGRPLRLRNAVKSGPVVDRLGDRRDAAGRVLNPYFDTTAFAALPNQYTVSPEPPYLDELRAPGVSRLNASGFKSFAIWERLRLEVRLEASDATNTPQFGSPGANMSNPATFGVISSADGSRLVLGGVRLTF